MDEAHSNDLEAGTIHLESILAESHKLEIRGPEDDWSGKSDPAQRRKLQNRLHQRAWRRRQAKLREVRAKVTDAEALTEGSWQHYLSASDQTEELQEPTHGLSLSFCAVSGPEIQQAVARLQNAARRDLLSGSLRLELLPTLVRVNAFRAFAENATYVGCASTWLDGEAVSDFGSSTALMQHSTSAHPSQYLRPTDLQRAVEHHPWIDLLPLPQMRDNILRLGEAYDDSLLCQDLVEVTNCPGDRAGLIVWGQPWDPRNWEVSEEFWRKWAWVLFGCWELCRATNYWRIRRGERALFPETWCSPPRQIIEVDG